MIDETDLEVSAAVLALLRSGSSGAASLNQYLGALAGTSDRRNVADVLMHFGISQPAVNASLSASRQEIEKGLTSGIVPVPLSSKRYPPTLRQIPDAPPVLFVRGAFDALSRAPGIAVVGTRKATVHGLTIARRLATYLSSNGWVVVSGLALGVDAAAHEGALLGSEPTIAVLAHGLERASPRMNEPLGMRILESGGAWVSEHAVGTSARPEYFVRRNRIQVGLSAASVIVEGELKSGSSTQAEFCLRYGRELFAVLPDFNAPVSIQSQLPRMLVRDRGARAISSRESYPELVQIAARKARELAAAP
jgi:DNA processing protein